MAFILLSHHQDYGPAPMLYKVLFQMPITSVHSSRNASSIILCFNGQVLRQMPITSAHSDGNLDNYVVYLLYAIMVLILLLVFSSSRLWPLICSIKYFFKCLSLQSTQTERFQYHIRH